MIMAEYKTISNEKIKYTKLLSIPTYSSICIQMCICAGDAPGLKRITNNLEKTLHWECGVF